MNETGPQDLSLGNSWFCLSFWGVAGKPNEKEVFVGFFSWREPWESLPGEKCRRVKSLITRLGDFIIVCKALGRVGAYR